MNAPTPDELWATIAALKSRAERAEALTILLGASLTKAEAQRDRLRAALERLLDRSERQAAGMLEEASCEVWYAHRDECRAALEETK